MMSDSISRAACRAPCPGVEGRVIISVGSTSGLYATPCRSFSRSASAWVTPSTWTTSVVTCAPAYLSDARCRIFPSWKMVTPVEPPPTSSSATPSSFSSSVSTAYDAASGSSTRSATRYPARCTLLRRFCAAVDCTVTRYISTSSRVPVIPTGSEMPRCWSTTYSCGVSCSSSWSRPSDTARATSFTRATSSGVISPPDTATTPVEVRAETCSPAIPQVTPPPFTPAIRSASRSAATMDRLVSSMSRTIPRRTPAFFASPTPSTLASGRRGRSPTTSAITAHVLVLPRSSPATTRRSRLTRLPHRPRPRSPCVARPPGPRSGHRAPRRNAPSPRDPVPPAPRPESPPARRRAAPAPVATRLPAARRRDRQIEPGARGIERQRVTRSVHRHQARPARARRERRRLHFPQLDGQRRRQMTHHPGLRHTGETAHPVSEQPRIAEHARPGSEPPCRDHRVGGEIAHPHELHLPHPEHPQPPQRERRAEPQQREH